MSLHTSLPESVTWGNITPCLWFDGTCAIAIEFYQKVFGARLVGPVLHGPKGKGVVYAILQVGMGQFRLADAQEGQWERGARSYTTVGLMVQVDGVEDGIAQALNAGCVLMRDVTDAFWGERMGTVRDPFGHCWTLSSKQTPLTQEELKSAQKNWLGSLEGNVAKGTDASTHADEKNGGVEINETVED